MKKVAGVFLALVLLFGIASVAMAQDTASLPVHGKDMPQLQMGDDQKAKMISLKAQILELKKEIIKQNLAKGTITQEQATKMEERINARLEALKSGQSDPFHRNHSPKCKIRQKNQ